MRGESTSFLHDITLALDRAGFRPGQSISDPQNRAHLSQRFHQQIQLLHDDWQGTSRKTVILVDGLDHVPRELKPQDSLLKHLPDPDQIPDGVLIVLGSQTDQLADLPSRVQESIQHQERRIHIERLSRESVAEIFASAQLPFELTGDQMEQAENIVAGHPLALALLLNRLAEVPQDESVEGVLSSTEPFAGQIDAIYQSHWRQVVEERADVQLDDLLGKLARLRPTLDLRWVEKWAGQQSVDRLRRSFYHFFRREDQLRWHLFHNSFRQFLLRRTAETPPDGYDQERDRRFHSEIADICAAEASTSRWNWEEAYHRRMASQNERVLELATADRLRSQVLAFRPLDSVVTEIKTAIAAAGALQDFVSLVRVLFLGVEFASREEHISTISLHRMLFELGEVDLACLHVRDGRQLRLTGESAYEFCVGLKAGGWEKEARLVFELAEPIDLLKPRPERESEVTADRVNNLTSWANTAVHFRPLPDIVRLIRATTQRAIWDRNEDKPEAVVALEDRMLVQVGFGLIDARRWEDLDRVLEELEQSNDTGRHHQFWLQAHAWQAFAVDGDAERAKKFVEKTRGAFAIEELDDSQKLKLAEGIFRMLGDVAQAKKVLLAAASPGLANTLSSRDDLSPYQYRLMYNRLLYAFGEKRRAAALIPDAEREDQQGQVFFERAISEIARLWAAAWTGNRMNGGLFVHECIPLIRFFYRNFQDADERARWNTFTAPRRAFFKLIVRVAEQHGTGVVPEIASAFENEWFAPDSAKYWGTSLIYEIVRELFAHGGSRQWCCHILGRCAMKEADYSDVSGRLSRLNEEVTAWLAIGEIGRARTLLVEMLRLSAGIGYRKDYQLDSWIKWMKLANKDDRAGTEQRICLFSSAVISMVESTEGSAAASAAEALLEAAFEWSPVRAVRLAKLLSEEGPLRYPDAAATIVRCALNCDKPPCELCLAYCCESLIPISTSADADLVAE
jgi:hypothetical protein